MPISKHDDTDNSSAKPSVKHATPISAPGGGKDAGGTENLRADYKCLEAPGNSTPTGGSGPNLPQHFTDDRV